MKYIDVNRNDKPPFFDDGDVEISSTSIDTRAYLRELPHLKKLLPPGARAYATDPDHYDFSGEWSIKDLKVSEARIDEDGALSLTLYYHVEFPPRFIIQYRNLQSISLAHYWSEEGIEMWPPSILVDEVLPHSAGVSHELLMRTGQSIVVLCRDLETRWIR